MEETKNENKILNFKDNSIQTLTLEELKSTVKEEDYNNQPVMGMYHHEYIENCIEQVKNVNLDYNIDFVWAAQNKDKSRPGVSVIEKYRQEYGDGDVRSFLLRRIFARILITTGGNKETNTAIVLVYSQNGFQMAFGPHVNMCENLCIMGADKYMTTFANKDKMPGPDRMIEVLSDWLHEFDDIRKSDLNIIKGFQSKKVKHPEVLEIVGDLTTMRLKRDNPDLFPNESGYPLNQSQITKFTLKYLEEHKNRDNFTVWDLYNFATEMYKPGETDMPLILPNNALMSQYLIERYKLN